MTERFDYFVIFAEMRTGSNFLEANLNAFDGFQSFGEAFNPHFIGYPNSTEILGVDLPQRNKDPMVLLAAIRDETDHLAGFRFFNDHDPRVLDAILDDQRCAKIILTRNPLDSYVSWKIAQETGQWKLTDVRKRRESKVDFDGAEFANHVARLQRFQVEILNRLQKTGQTGFYLAYEDLQDIDVMNGLARFLGSDERLEALDSKLKRQNPSPISDKVSNFEDVSAGLAALDRFNLSRTPNFEPRRGAAVPTYVAPRNTGLLFMPLQGGPTDQICAWLTALEGGDAGALMQDFNQRRLRDWKMKSLPNRSFTVLRHPVARAHEVFCTRILETGPGSFRKIRRVLRNRFGLPIPEDMPDTGYDLAAHRSAFLAFLDFVLANLNGQTGIRQDAHWSSQAGIIAGFSQVTSPDMILREEELPQALPHLATTVGAEALAYSGVSRDSGPRFELTDVYTAEVEAKTRAAYARDYEAFGFENWR